ncbi:creatininase family protein [Conexibacter stalactiti]|uniref:Creatininase family protein n=1 Tax=Conexibacter stalactiti TaxID=1940611 RepID=A0ABU4HQP4_9ACTN|nr:creatininase family protein [Conexibacter stalactiti]MDW5595616.1 creatininase family protein [Conexibacter stalactiti]MEC5036258.1 creatininase family protein [Conexibacter stalactiti]
MSAADAASGAAPGAISYELLNSGEVTELLARRPAALLPLGAVENHGEHLPLATDNLLADAVARQVAAQIADSVVLPALPYGQVWSTSAYAGTISLTLDTMVAALYEIGASLFAQGVPLLVFVNGHMGNLDAMKLAARRLHDEHGMKVLSLTYPGIGEITQAVLEERRLHPSYFHACELETSYMLHLAPEHVRMELARANRPTLPADIDVSPTPWHTFSPDSPVLGDPTLATAEKGRAIVDVAVAKIVELIGVARAQQSART